MEYFDINSTYEKVDFSPTATAYLDRIIENASPDSFTEDQRNSAVQLARTYGDRPYDGRFDPVNADWVEAL